MKLDRPITFTTASSGGRIVIKLAGRVDINMWIGTDKEGNQLYRKRIFPKVLFSNDVSANLLSEIILVQQEEVNILAIKNHKILYKRKAKSKIWGVTDIKSAHYYIREM